jgi:hypothetical protein
LKEIQLIYHLYDKQMEIQVALVSDLPSMLEIVMYNTELLFILYAAVIVLHAIFNYNSIKFAITVSLSLTKNDDILLHF